MAPLTEDQFTARMSPEVRDLYRTVRTLILSLGGDVRIGVVGDYIHFSVNGRQFARVPVRVTRLSLFLMPDALGVERGTSRRVHNVLVTDKPIRLGPVMRWST